MKMRRGIIYVRESTTKQDWETQLLECRNYCNNNGIEIIKEYIEQISGARNDRKGFLELQDKISNSEFDILVVCELSRTTRDFVTYKIMMQNMKESNIELHSLQEGILTNDDDIDSTFGIDIMALLNERERKIVGRRIKTRIGFLRENGHWSGGSLPMGYDFIDKKLVPNNEASKIIEIFDLFLKGVTISEIAKTLNISDPKKVSRILENPIYIGKISIKSEIINGIKKKIPTRIIDGIHPAIIDHDTFELVQNIKQKNRNNRNSFSTNYLLSNIFCYCGGRMYPRTNKNGLVSYACCDDYNSINGDFLDMQVLEILKNRISAFNVLDSLNDDPYNPKNRLKVYKNEYDKLLKQEKILTKKLLEERITDDLFNQLNDELSNKKINLKYEIEKLSEISLENNSSTNNKELLEKYVNKIINSENKGEAKKIFSLIIKEIKLVNNFRAVVFTNLE